MKIPGGGQKAGLYSLLIFLALLICINIGLTLWLLSTLHFHLVGGGGLLVVGIFLIIILYRMEQGQYSLSRMV